ncbi:hypothetical protein OQI_14090 [Streptomyces pharetrae CZA14]|uniref:Pentapeptide repeat-containing protein n=1 Tax=Streptomyces pharetrae CZA14 TaxID=1144883 RepID=A0ABX3YK39_9ACTN|nr:hypothetical protein OQI_14090 [Streptomyces pharetrae CZA14]
MLTLAAIIFTWQSLKQVDNEQALIRNEHSLTREGQVTDRFNAAVRPAHGAYLPRADLRGADLADAELADADLHGADVSRANLFDADLTRANLDGAKLTRVNLDGADLVGAKR